MGKWAPPQIGFKQQLVIAKNYFILILTQQHHQVERRRTWLMEQCGYKTNEVLRSVWFISCFNDFYKKVFFWSSLTQRDKLLKPLTSWQSLSDRLVGPFKSLHIQGVFFAGFAQKVLKSPFQKSESKDMPQGNLRNCWNISSKPSHHASPKCWKMNSQFGFWYDFPGLVDPKAARICLG